MLSAMQRYFSDKVLTEIRQEITACGGNEVFFIGRTDAAKIVVEVEALARGNSDAVAAIMISASFGDIAIHNHPSGNLTPSGADLEIASVLGNQGVGFYIIDNAATHCYQAVSPFAARKVEQIPLAEIDAYFAPGGVIAANLANYEQRSEQSRMAFAVAEAFNADRVTMIEAGTGTGKSLAYLLPAALWTKLNQEKVVISTNTINLQEQLTGKDIPFLQKYAGMNFKSALIKGRGNYLCIRKLNAHREQPELFPDAGSEFKAIIEWSSTTATGARDDLGFVPKSEIWEELCCEGDQCGRAKCRHYNKCHYYTSRRGAAGADILIVNHALLMADLALRQQTGQNSTSILPPFQRLIIDEAHHLEDVATASLSSQVTRHGLLKLLAKLRNPRRADRGLLPQLSATIMTELPDCFDELYLSLSKLLDEALIPGLPALIECVDREMDGLALALEGHLQPAERSKGEMKLRLTADVYASGFWKEALKRILNLAGELSGYASLMRRVLNGLRALPEKPSDKLAGLMVDVKGVAGRIEAAAEALNLFTGHEAGICRWFEMKKGPKGLVLRICSSPLDVAPSLKNVLFDSFRSVVLTSATLAVGGKFDYLATRTGIALLPTVRVSELLLASPFDYEKQALVGVPSDMPEPTDRSYELAVSAFIVKALAKVTGGTFILFTSYELLKRIYNRIAPQLGDMGLLPMRQGETGRHHLLAKFKSAGSGVLFGTDSFWEGVDVQGEALETVIITRLPFRVPTEPVQEARSEYISASGGDPFMDYTVPQAVIKFKQGFGRLIRSSGDRGAVLILDSRVLNRGYGRIFLKSLPDVKVSALSGNLLIEELQKHY